MSFVRTIAFLHLAIYLGIMWYGWQHYKLLRKRSWLFMGIGFALLLAYRVIRFVEMLVTHAPSDTERVLLPFIGAILLLVAFRLLYGEHKHLISLMAEPFSPLKAGAQSVEYWMQESRKNLDEIRKIVREEIAATRTTLTVTGPVVETPPEK